MWSTLTDLFTTARLVNCGVLYDDLDVRVVNSKSFVSKQELDTRAAVRTPGLGTIRMEARHKARPSGRQLFELS